MDGLEIRLFDPRRQLRDWTEIIKSSQCAVFLKHRETSLVLAPDGKPYRDAAQTTCLLFDRIDDARRFCEAKVQSLPHLRREIYDSEGLAHPPLLALIHPDRLGPLYVLSQVGLVLFMFLVGVQMRPSLVCAPISACSTAPHYG